MNPAKTQHYNMDGNGRDTYIFKTNGGFYPDRKTNGIEDIGKYTRFIKKGFINICLLRL